MHTSISDSISITKIHCKIDFIVSVMFGSLFRTLNQPSKYLAIYNFIIFSKRHLLKQIPQDIYLCSHFWADIYITAVLYLISYVHTNSLATITTAPKLTDAIPLTTK